MQRELARLESELKSSVQTSGTPDFTLIREKDLQIEKIIFFPFLSFACFDTKYMTSHFGTSHNWSNIADVDYLDSHASLHSIKLHQLYGASDIDTTPLWKALFILSN